MSIQMKATAFLMSILVISGCSNDAQPADEMNHSMMNHDSEEMDHSMMDGSSMNNGHMSHDNVVRLNDSTGENEVNIPPLLASDTEKGRNYTIKAQKGEVEIFDGIKTATLGYNGDFLGPVLRFKKGETVTIKTINELDEMTTFHWHGLEVSGEADGGPHKTLSPGEEETITFEVTQEAATLWFHPHPEGKTSEQVYKGLAGLIYIEDNNSTELELPNEYGKTDIPLIFQDRTFNDQKQLDYKAVMNDDGTIGDTLLINGTINPKLKVTKEKVRLRLVNGSNARNYTFKLNTGDSFVQIATDGGFLNEPVTLNEVTLTPSERAEIVVDFAQLNTSNDLALINEDGSTLLPFELVSQQEKVTKLTEELNDFSVTEEERNMQVTKHIELFGMMDHVEINGKKFDPERIDFTQKQGVTEVWEIYNKKDMMGGMIHPFHIHGTQFKIISRDGVEPAANEKGWKDSIAVHPGEKVRLAVQFKHKGVYMFHCHILEHEDNGMMGQIEVK
ncbi:multicopper oxidase domain-containing protein [Sporosarcina sp. GW1-11]|uniref:multicopper oxidase family protein n=1 Tax=Sporosarcina sp. GW1-11 TaxID=2899126 RepID=UPI00294D22C0|nr:multicopper oxidase domain-containing protein [Sporosarcina sp. GW1-11]MDV6378275.1 multicopper oxidase domain-containing protein [Sporosarcina sp. GW1-11]